MEPTNTAKETQASLPVEKDIVKLISEIRETAIHSSERVALQLKQLADTLEANITNKETQH